MSTLSIAPYFPFRRIKIIGQTVTPNATGAHIPAEPDKRFQSICHGCGQKASGIHSWTQRKIRDLSFATAQTGSPVGIAKCFVLTVMAFYRGPGTVSSVSSCNSSFSPSHRKLNP